MNKKYFKEEEHLLIDAPLKYVKDNQQYILSEKDIEVVTSISTNDELTEVV